MKKRKQAVGLFIHLLTASFNKQRLKTRRAARLALGSENGMARNKIMFLVLDIFRRETQTLTKQEEHSAGNYMVDDREVCLHMGIRKASLICAI